MKSCQLKLKKLTDYQVHRWAARGKKNFECVVCGLKHGTQNAMYLHMLWKHPETKFVRCKLCSTYIDAAIGLPAHFDECHSGEISTSLKSKVLKCKFCEKIFEGQRRKYLRSKHTATFHSDVAVRCAAFNCCRYKLWFYILVIVLLKTINYCLQVFPDSGGHGEARQWESWRCFDQGKSVLHFLRSDLSRKTNVENACHSEAQTGSSFLSSKSLRQTFQNNCRDAKACKGGSRKWSKWGNDTVYYLWQEDFIIKVIKNYELQIKCSAKKIYK